MKKQRDWVQLLTNVAVVIGLLLLIYELNQSRDLTRAQIVDGAYDAAVFRNLAILGESPEEAIARSLFHPEDVTEADAIVLSHFYTALLVSWLRNRDERGLGYFERGFEEVIASEAYFLNTIPGRKWWASVRDFQEPELAAAVDKALEPLTPEAQRMMIERLVGENARGRAATEPDS